MKRNENSGGQASMGLSAQTILLIRLKLRNCLGLNEVRHGKDGRKSLRLTGMLLAYLLLGGMMILILLYTDKISMQRPATSLRRQP